MVTRFIFFPYHRSTLLSRSDSAYGESMRSSSSSPQLTPSTPRIDQSYGLDGGHVMGSHHKDTRSGDSSSPKSDGVNEISSGMWISRSLVDLFIIVFLVYSLIRTAENIYVDRDCSVRFSIY